MIKNKMNVVFLALFLTALLIATPNLQAQTKSKKEKGLLPEIQQSSDSPEVSDEKSLASEILITKSEEKAILSLQKILAKNRGSDQEPDLMNRLAELYMRRSKSGRYFDLQRGNEKVQKAMSHLRQAPTSGKGYITKAIAIYNQIQSRFPQYPLMDEVLFNNAFAHQQTNQDKKSLEIYQTLITKFPKSPYVAEAYMGKGEILYNQGQFQNALKELLQLENFKNSKVYLYGIYKAAWCYYNLKDSVNAVQQLLVVLRDETEKYNLRKETMKDLVLFTSDFYKVGDIYPFFKKHAKSDEIEQVILDFANLYVSHSRYQELNQLMSDYLDDNPISELTVRLEIYFADNFENLKKRDDVVKHIAQAQNHCQVNSKWSKKMSQETINDSCNSRLKSFQAELIVKWWEIWEKNKAHAEFNERLISLLQVAVLNENAAETDKKTRYLLAELLFHNKKFKEASEQYQNVADKSQDKKMRHDSYYSALYAFEKYLESKPKLSKTEIQDKTFVLAQQYLTFSPQGEHADDVRLKLATIYLDKKDFKETEKYLVPLLNSKNRELQTKAQDIQLEIYNIQKDFSSLKEFSKKLAQGEKSVERKKSFEKISKEAEFNDIILRDPKEEKLLAYAEANKGTELGRNAHWQVLTKLFAEKRDWDALKQGEIFTKSYPNDKELEKIRKELLAIALEYGLFDQAVKWVTQSQKPTPEENEKIGDFYQLDNQWKLSYEKYLPLLENFKPGSKDYLRIFEKIEFLAKQDSSIKTEKIIQNLVSKGIEPFATRYLISNAEKLYSQKQFSQAFETARKINSRPVSSEEKFSSRMIQAQVLEGEFLQQSVKTSLDRLSLVLAIKTEKFDKSFTAFNDALKMTTDAEKQILALLGINRSFDHFISTLETMSLPSEMSAQDQEALRSELVQLTSPLKERREENQQKIQEIQGRGKKSDSSLHALQFLSDPTVQSQWPLLVSQDPSGEDMKSVQQNSNLWNFEQLLNDLNKPQMKEWNIYRLSLLALKDKKLEKSDYLAARLKAKSTSVTYLRASILLNKKQYLAANKEFEKMIDKKIEIDELKILSAFQSFSGKDYLSAIEALESVKKYSLTTLHLMPVYVDSLVGAGQMEKASKFLSKAILKEKDSSLKETLQTKLSGLQPAIRNVSSEAGG